MQDYLRHWLIALVVLLIGAVAFSWFADPYGLYWPRVPGERKPYATTQGELVKPYLVLDREARGLVLGNSRAEIGFDPDDSAWPAEYQPVYNLALPGSDLRAARRLFEHALAWRKPSALLIGLDFRDFLVGPDQVQREPAFATRLLLGPDGRPNNGRRLKQVEDHAATLVSLDTLLRGLDTLRRQGDEGTDDLTAAGFNPLHEYPGFARNEGYFALFRQRDIDNIRSLSRYPRNLYARGTSSSAPLEDLAAILSAARAHGIQVDLAIYPYHGHLLEIYRGLGYWPLFEDWKRDLTHLVESVGRGSARLWDFSGYHGYAREPVPPPGDRETTVPWYWEAGHFKPALGHKMLEAIYGSGEPGFGVRLTSTGIEAHLAELARGRARYVREAGTELADLNKLLPSQGN